jgi:uncharacterized protein YjiS (DUF1127 family)
MRHASSITKEAIMTRHDMHMTISLPIPNVPRKGWFFRVTQMFGLWQQRRRLACLDEAALRDIGLTRTEALTEAERPIWDVPANWLR